MHMHNLRQTLSLCILFLILRMCLYVCQAYMHIFNQWLSQRVFQAYLMVSSVKAKRRCWGRRSLLLVGSYSVGGCVLVVKRIRKKPLVSSVTSYSKVCITVVLSSFLVVLYLILLCVSFCLVFSCLDSFYVSSSVVLCVCHSFMCLNKHCYIQKQYKHTASEWRC